MQLVLFRHAEKSSVGAQNPALSSKGHAQAKKIAKLAMSGDMPTPARLLSSPLTRAQQTLAPLADQYGRSIETIADLNERQHSENVDQFRTRIHRFLRWCETQSGTVYVCTHLDWLDEAMSLITADVNLMQDQYQHWPPAAFLIFDINDTGLWVLEKQGDIPL